MTKVFKKEHYHRVMGVTCGDPDLTPEENAANAYACGADGNGIDEFTLGDKLLMRAAFLAGIEWAKKNRIPE